MLRNTKYLMIVEIRVNVILFIQKCCNATTESSAMSGSSAWSSSPMPLGWKSEPVRLAFMSPSGDMKRFG